MIKIHDCRPYLRLNGNVFVTVERQPGDPAPFQYFEIEFTTDIVDYDPRLLPNALRMRSLVVLGLSIFTKVGPWMCLYGAKVASSRYQKAG